MQMVAACLGGAAHMFDDFLKCSSNEDCVSSELSAEVCMFGFLSTVDELKLHLENVQQLVISMNTK